MSLNDKLRNYVSIFPEEKESKTKMLNFLNNCYNPFDRDNREGHFTASAFLLNSHKTKFALLHHRKLNKWLQPGGHCDGNNDVLAVAIKEAQEESGIMEIEPVNQEIYDIDIHLFPASNKEAEHYHYDIRFLLKTSYNDILMKNHESNDLKWFEFNNYAFKEIKLENSIKRMIKKFKKLQNLS